MKKITITVLAVLLLSGTIFSQEKFTLKGHIGNYADSSRVYLEYLSDNVYVTDSAWLVNDRFQFQGAVAEPVKATLAVIPKGTTLKQISGKNITEVFLAEGTITVQGDDLQDVKIKGNSYNADQAAYKSYVKAVETKLQTIQREYENSSPEKQQDEELFEQVLEKCRRLIDTLQNLQAQFVMEQPDKLVSLYLLKDLLMSHKYKEELIDVYNHMPETLKNHSLGRYVQTIVNGYTRLAIGTMAPDFVLPDTAGTEVSLSSLRGQYVLLDFWSSGCAPCRAENPNVIKAFNTYKDKGFTVLMVSLDRLQEKDKWMKAIHDDKTTQWQHLSDLKGWKSEIVQLYGIQGIPQNFLLDKEGRVIARDLKGENLHATLAGLLQ